MLLGTFWSGIVIALSAPLILLWHIWHSVIIFWLIYWSAGDVFVVEELSRSTNADDVLGIFWSACNVSDSYILMYCTEDLVWILCSMNSQFELC